MTLPRSEASKLLYDWDGFWARPNQREPKGDWYIWVLQAGRGFGKTRVGSESVIKRVKSGKFGRIALVSETAADCRDVMIEGESGIKAVAPPDWYPKYEPSKRRLTWSNGAIATTYSAEEGKQLRGPQHDFAWADEIAKWKHKPKGQDNAWDNLRLGLRLGPRPQIVATTTPKPNAIIRGLAKESANDPNRIVITRGSTYDNIANLSPDFIRDVVDKYSGTRLGKQELEGILLDDNPGALWKRDKIDEFRVTLYPSLVKIVVGVDPSAGSGDGHADTGITVTGKDAKGHGYVLGDESINGTPRQWGSAAIAAYFKYNADLIVGEINNGGDMVEEVIRSVAESTGHNRDGIPYKKVWASRGKRIRAEPVSALYEKGMIHHVGFFEELEEQLCTWVPGDESPDRMDSLVWGIHELFFPDDNSDDVWAV